ncbi:MAG: hypothetical protein OER21_08815 [Gemmatimonadota bacterium]|nr:hypothetical protein [Gemmatimonadota bacterium]
MRVIAIAVSSTLVVAAPAAAEPYLAVRTGLKCSQCHTNATGGGNRTDFGSIYAQTQLPMRPAGSVVSKALADVLRVGADLRFEAAGTFKASTPRTGMGLDVAQLYVAVQLLENRVWLYVDQTVGPDRAVAREAFGMVRRLPGESYVKAGKFLPPFGLRLQDDAEYVRERTGFTYFTPDQGIELGAEPGPFALAVALTNGTAGTAENDDGKQLTSTAAVVFRHWRVGASASLNDATGNRREVVGGFGGVAVGPLALLGEVDYVRDEPAAGDTVRQVVAYAEADWLVIRGLNLKATYGYLDPSLDVAENPKVRARFGLEFFPVPFVRVAGFYTVLRDIPQATTDLDRWSVEAQLHF